MSIMHKLFKPKCLRRIILFLALAFPLVYLTGSFFFALNGSHGNVLLAQEEEVVTNTEIRDWNQMFKPSKVFSHFPVTYRGIDFSSDDTSIYLSGTASDTAYFLREFDFVDGHVYYLKQNYSDSVTHNLSTWIVSLYFNANYYYMSPSIFTADSRMSNFAIRVAGSYSFTESVSCSPCLFDLTRIYGEGNEPSTIADFEADYPLSYYSYNDGESIVHETMGTPTYSEYIFNQVFGNDNIITQMGYYALAEQEKGFAPISSLISYVDGNVFHWGTDNSMMLFVYGYAYYAINTLIVYEIVVIAVKLLLLPLKAVDVFDKGEDIHD